MNSATFAELRHRAAVRAQARRYPRSPYIQALMFYLRNWRAYLSFAWLVCYFLWIAAVIIDKAGYYFADRQQDWSSMRQVGGGDYWSTDAAIADKLIWAVVTGVMFILPAVAVIASLARSQIRDWRGTMVPGYRFAHVLVSAAIMGGIIVLVAVGAEVVRPFAFMGLLALCIWIATTIAACAMLPQKQSAAAGVLSVILFSARPVQIWLGYSLISTSFGPQILSLSMALLSLGGLWLWLATTRGEYASRKSEDLMLGAAWAGWRRRPGETLTQMTLATRLKLWRIPSSSGLAPPACAAGLLVLILILQLLPMVSWQAAVGLAGFSVILPAAAVATQWTRRLPALACELTRPITRTRFIKDLGLAFAVDWTAWWLYLTAAVSIAIALTLVMGNQPVDWRHALKISSNCMIASATIQFSLYALIVWIMCYQSPWLVSLTLIAGSLATMIGFVYFLDSWRLDPLDPSNFLLAMSAASMVILFDAYRRWRART